MQPSRPTPEHALNPAVPTAAGQLVPETGGPLLPPGLRWPLTVDAVLTVLGCAALEAGLRSAVPGAALLIALYLVVSVSAGVGTALAVSARRRELAGDVATATRLGRKATVWTRAAVAGTVLAVLAVVVTVGAGDLLGALLRSAFSSLAG